ncbi:hypothetical protein [Zavarzinella formosa]|uniref:hypothetical protein n=1 Tax=Zavarzinella formosa TaxID=360055 RepID=UPI000377391A|nr:hypothetical protein [Zavarzinella formosa]
MATNKFLENLRGAKEANDIPPQADDDSFESPAGDGRDSHHQALAVQLVQLNRDCRAVLYGSIIGTIDYNPSKGISWSFEGKDSEDVVISGNHLDRIFDKPALGKREVIRCNSSTVLSITFTKAEENAT